LFRPQESTPLPGISASAVLPPAAIAVTPPIAAQRVLGVSPVHISVE
jgi:hypothetical protein